MYQQSHTYTIIAYNIFFKLSNFLQSDCSVLGELMILRISFKNKQKVKREGICRSNFK